MKAVHMGFPKAKAVLKHYAETEMGMSVQSYFHCDCCDFEKIYFLSFYLLHSVPFLLYLFPMRFCMDPIQFPFGLST